jgi:acetyl/propionyl-CoA carboxylase alpha subunit
VEFLLDNATGRFYFLEMNTRLQVEHPVTELAVSVAGAPLDLVDLQLQVAAGLPLGFDQDDVALTGHAIEARVYAEDSFGGFLPQAGTATLVRWPARARVDHALESGQVVSTAYDPMLGKVITAGPDRETARLALVAALDDTAVLGLTTNAGFLRALVASEEFRDATIDTAWLDTAEVPAPDPALARVFAAWTQAMLLAEHGETGVLRSDGFRLNAGPAPFRIELDEVVLVDRHRGLVGDVPVTQLLAERHVVQLVVEGRRHQAVVDVATHVTEVVVRGQRFVFERPDVLATHGVGAGEGTLVSPMPGTVLAVDVEVDTQVSAGQRLGVVEAMKMELALKAPHDGTVTVVGAGVGDQVKLGQVLFEVRATGGTPG